MSYVFRCAKHLPTGKMYFDWRKGTTSQFSSVKSLIDWATSNMDPEKSKTVFASFAVRTMYDDWFLLTVDGLTKEQAELTKNALVARTPPELLFHKKKLDTYSFGARIGYQ